MQQDYLQSILLLASAGAMFVKVLIALARMAYASGPAWLWPLLSLIAGIVCVSLLMIVGGQSFTVAPVIAQAILGGILATGLALGITELDKQAQTRIRAARLAAKGKA